MSKPPIKAAYEVAKLVHLGALGQGAGAKKLESESGFNVNSARDLIMVFRHLMRGESFQRGLSGPDMDYFLSRIASDYGPVVLRTAVQSLWLHLGYYEGIRKVTMHKLRAVAASHQARAAAPETITEFEATFSAAVKRLLAESSSTRQERLKRCTKTPTSHPRCSLCFRAKRRCGRRSAIQSERQLRKVQSRGSLSAPQEQLAVS